MLYHLYEFLKGYDIPGMGMLQYISFRSGAAIILSLLITMGFGKKMISAFCSANRLVRKFVIWVLKGSCKKRHANHGGNHHTGFHYHPDYLAGQARQRIYPVDADHYRMARVDRVCRRLHQVFLKDKQGLAGKFKIMGQVGLGLIVVATLFFSDDVVVREKQRDEKGLLIK
jgi:phospho-N-acetylmuramoyl-pentapeptide-transferase